MKVIEAWETAITKRVQTYRPVPGSIGLRLRPWALIRRPQGVEQPEIEDQGGHLRPRKALVTQIRLDAAMGAFAYHIDCRFDDLYRYLDVRFNYLERRIEVIGLIRRVSSGNSDGGLHHLNDRARVAALCC